MANPPALSFDEMIKADRKKKAAQDLAQNLLGSKRPSASGAGSLATRRQPAFGASLSSRVGVAKRSSSAQPKSHIDGKWGHDLHHVNNPQVSRTAQLSRTSSASNIERGTRIYSDVQRDISNGGGASSQATIRTGSQMSIRGMAKTGLYVVVASNFALGTTAEDIEAAMAPVGGEIQSCHLISSRPTVMCELVFTDKEGADNVVATFNNQKADGRLLYVYHKQGGPSPQLHPLQSAVSASSSAPATPAPVIATPAPDPPKGPRNPAPREVSAPRDERDEMDVDNEPSTASDSRTTKNQRYDDGDRYRDLERDRDRDRNGYSDGRYGFRGQFDRRDNMRRDFGRDRGPRGGGLYSDGMYPSDRRYRP